MSTKDLEFGVNSRESSPNREAPNKHVKGSKKYKEMVDRGSKAADQKNLPFTFSKPKKPEKTPVDCQCPYCDRIISVTKTTVCVICAACKNFYHVNEETIIRS